LERIKLWCSRRSFKES